jgi:hypothetical protein
MKFIFAALYISWHTLRLKIFAKILGKRNAEKENKPQQLILIFAALCISWRTLRLTIFNKNLNLKDY